MQSMQDFVHEVNRRLRDKSPRKIDIMVLICRSGDRSRRGANRLADDGFGRAYSVVVGFDGDSSPRGTGQGRDVLSPLTGWPFARLRDYPGHNIRITTYN